MHAELLAKHPPPVPAMPAKVATGNVEINTIEDVNRTVWTGGTAPTNPHQPATVHLPTFSGLPTFDLPSSLSSCRHSSWGFAAASAFSAAKAPAFV
eukprot:9311358-Pyramimonas_sp.AAC.1